MGVGIPYILPLTFMIDVATLGYCRFKKIFKKISEKFVPAHRKELEYRPSKTPKSKKEVSVIISAHKEEDIIEKSIRSVFRQNYPIKNLYISDSNLDNTKKAVRNLEERIKKLKKEFPNIIYWSKEGITSKAEKINSLVRDPSVDLGDYVYLIDSDLRLSPDTIEKLVEGFTEDNIAAVTSYGYVTPPDNYWAKYFHYGKEWINRMGKFRKIAQKYRRAMFVVCGASYMVRLDVLKKIELSTKTKTEDTDFSWQLQEEGYKIEFVPDAVVSSKDVPTLKSQLKQSYRWYMGTWQNLYLHKNIFGLKSKAKSLAYLSILPGFIESLLYSCAIVLLPFIAYFFPIFAVYFLVGDTILSFIAPVIAPLLSGEPETIPREIFHTLRYYHQIIVFKIMAAVLWLGAGFKVCYHILTGKQKKWVNKWGV